jgi:hypothetical protein
MSQVGFAQMLAPLFAPVMNRIFGVSGFGAFAYLSTLFSGVPVGTKIVCEAYTAGQIDRKEADILLALCSNLGPIFILSTVGLIFFGSMPLAVIFLIINYASPFFSAIIVSYGHERIPVLTARIKEFPEVKFTKAFGAAIKDSVTSILNVGGFMVFFSVGIRLVTSVLNLEAGGMADAVVKGILEVTAGTQSIGALKDSYFQVSLGLAGAAIGFGGLCILFQSLSFICDTDLDIGVFVKAKLVQGAAGGVLGLGCAMMIPRHLATFSTTSAEIDASTGLAASGIAAVLIPAGAFLALSCALAWLGKAKGRARTR